ncbi:MULTISPECIES: TraE/TraK family type IV conjugative transfer system protein [Herbaspirillum]|uniref:TraE/TraK family type IV conjugative transfer system protein n=1 Tax=Herbaspirillum TaxID=963 RepID=UPI000C0A27AA|nr:MULTISPECIES: TraE/TraK family type IV conjugative transfer system protein [Herbaspirillum]MAF04679.1 type VI secretion protein [Herbaspirillum sp.]UWE19364.1 type VI secretion protein [Herbaspirillum huttiense]|tara:strand:+ start:8221 stop:8829 length:609 start_codon:yes stop_codon:yes gene_type:complete
MEQKIRHKTIDNLESNLRLALLAIFGLVVVVVVLSLVLATQKKIVQTQVPGMPDGASISEDTADREAQFAVIQAVTTAIASINPSNAAYQKRFIKAFLSSDSYTKISSEIDLRVKKMEAEHELGSFYWVTTKGVSFDPSLNRFFIIGDVHTVNAAKDTGEPYVFEYSMKYENYRPVVYDVSSYRGTKARDSDWLKSNKEGVK